jgi:hypothetical protein
MSTALDTDKQPLVEALLVAWEAIPDWSEGDLAEEVMARIERALATVGLDTQDKIIHALRALKKREDEE